MEIVFVGAGRVATHLAKALYAGGHRITAVYSRTITSAEALAGEVHATPSNRIDALPEKADVFVLSVKDSVLKDVISELRKGREQQVFLHTAGSIPMSVFGEHQHCGVFYPMQTFSKEKAVDFSRVHIFIEGRDAGTLDLARKVAETLSANVHELNSSERRYLHLAAVFACNFANHCYALSAQILEAHGLPFESMLPLIRETAEKVETVHPREAQTGPAARRDENVMDAQKALLADNPQMQQIYDIMSKSIIETLNSND
jgi:predicted short-subunit dehydrogenase-like oxidoreductase (DUF2520 family)